mgnify:CR=1 FL=1
MYGERIKKIMDVKGIGNKELSEKSNIPLGTLNKIIYGDTLIIIQFLVVFCGDTKNPSLDKMRAIANALNCTLDDFIESSSSSTDFYLLAAHHDEPVWTDEELAEIEEFKKYVLSKRKK